MKNLLKISALSLALIGISSNSYAASAVGNITATVSTAISIANTADIGFGRFVSDTSPSKITINPTGTVRTISSGTPTLITPPSPSVGAFTVSGDASATYSVTLPSSATLTSGSNSMTVDTFTSSPGTTGTIGVGGTQVLNTGATLNINASQAPGSYVGTYTITVAYN